MTVAQASTAAGEPLIEVGDGVWKNVRVVGQTYEPVGDPGLSALFGSSPTTTCLEATAAANGPDVYTAEGVHFGTSKDTLTATYGDRLEYVPAPATGIKPSAGYLLRESAGDLAFVLDADEHIISISAGPGVLPSTACG